MPRLNKRKAQLQRISQLRDEGFKRHKRENDDIKTKSVRLAQIIQDEDFWDEYESFGLGSSSDESSSDESGADLDSDELESEGETCLESVKIPKEIKETSLQPAVASLKWMPGAGEYLRGIRGCGSASTDKRQKRHRQELAAEASKCRSIPEMFEMQQQLVVPAKQKTKAEIQIQASQDLDDLLQHKTKQITSKLMVSLCIEYIIINGQ